MFHYFRQFDSFLKNKLFVFKGFKSKVTMSVSTAPTEELSSEEIPKREKEQLSAFQDVIEAGQDVIEAGMKPIYEIMEAFGYKFEKMRSSARVAKNIMENIIVNPEILKMAWAINTQDEKAIEEMNERITSIYKKARSLKKGETLSDEDAEYMKNIYTLLAAGGMVKQAMSSGPREDFYAASQLINHYINGDGSTLEIQPDVYMDSEIVKWSMKKMTGKLKKRLRRGRLKEGDSGEISSTRMLSRMKFRKGYREKGEILKGGVLLAEQNNQALKNTDNRFILKGRYKVEGGKLYITWRVDSYYDFENNPNHVSSIPVPGGKGLRITIPDTLSHLLAKQGTAKEFKHYSEWDTAVPVEEEIRVASAAGSKKRRPVKKA